MEYLSLILIVYFGLSVLYLLFFALASHLPRQKKPAKSNKMYRFGILIPAYKENKIIRTVAASARNHDYPNDLFDVYVIADTLDVDTIEAIKSSGAGVIEVAFESSTKAKSLNAALDLISPEKYDYALILDVDNIMEDGFLLKINESINQGYSVVQGHRTAKNTNSPTAMLDAASEEIGNSLFRKAFRNVGMSAYIIGSGFAIDWKLFRRLMNEIRDVAGEDRELSIRIISEKIKVEYCEDAYVFDEKVETWDVYTRQRSRWAAAHLDFLLKYFFSSFKHLLLKGNFDYFNKVIMSFMPPRVLMFGVLGIVFMLSIAVPQLPHSGLWQLLFILMSASMFIALPRKLYSKQFLKALLEVPKMFFYMIISWTKIKGQSKKFLHTPHSYSEDKK